MKNVYLLLATGLLAGAGCTSSSTENKDAATAASSQQLLVRPAAVADPSIDKFRFPEDSTTIQQWVEKGDSTAISRHSWGIWTMLTAQVAPLKVVNGDTLRVFETWKTKKELARDMFSSEQPTAQRLTALATQERPLVRRLERPRQFFHGAHLRQLMSSGKPSFADSTVEVVSYNSPAAQTILKGRLFDFAVLNGMTKPGKLADIPDFPNSAIVIKPVYEIVPGPERTGKAYNSLFRMKVWANIPTSLRTNPVAFPQTMWNSWVYVDARNRGRGKGKVAYAGFGGDTAQVTYNVRDFVHYTLTKAEAYTLDSSKTVVGAQGGDIAVLVGMHITTREISRWTWQTLWWAPDPEHAPAPTSPGVTANKPAQLRGAPRHYALAIAYQMISPVQPPSGGTNKGRSIYAFNPYLEAAFSSKDLSNDAVVMTNGVRVVNNVGIRTNCMSCHAQANHSPADTILNKNTSPGYIGNTYVSLTDPKFKGVLRTHFLWSVPDMAKELYLAKKGAAKGQ